MLLYLSASLHSVPLDPQQSLSGADQTDDVQPEEAAKPKKRYGPKRSETPAAAPARRQGDSAGDQGTKNSRKPKGKAACKKKSKPE